MFQPRLVALAVQNRKPQRQDIMQSCPDAEPMVSKPKIPPQSDSPGSDSTWSDLDEDQLEALAGVVGWLKFWLCLLKCVELLMSRQAHMA